MKPNEFLIHMPNNKNIVLRKLEADDFDKLFDYLQNLSTETKARFGPHLFDKQSILDFYHPQNRNTAFVGIDTQTQEIVAYSILKTGFIEKDKLRYGGYGIMLSITADVTFAPSVADAWQGVGLGVQMFRYILNSLQNTDIERVILWGGVQAGNQKAIRYYEKLGFKIYGEFERNGQNFDMMLSLI